MQYLIVFLEGIITFISPCLLPMLPVYLSYFVGGEEEHSQRQTVINALGFVCGFTLMFLLLGGFAGSVGRLFRAHQTAINIITGGVVVLFGLSFLGVLRPRLFGRTFRLQAKLTRQGFWPSLVFGLTFSISWTPCVGAFLGSALMLASQEGSVRAGMLMLLVYSLGLGVPFVASALLIDLLRDAFNWIKQHYTVINRICGGFLVAIGLLMMSGLFGRFLSLLS